MRRWLLLAVSLLASLVVGSSARAVVVSGQGSERGLALVPSTGSQLASPPNAPGLRVRLQLLPQALHDALFDGVMVRVTSNEAAAGVASVSISRALANRAGIKVGRLPTVVIGVGTLSGLKAGTVTLHLRLARSTATRLQHVGHVRLTIRLALVNADGGHYAIDAAGRY